METPFPSTLSPSCCSSRSKLLCLSAGLVILIIVAATSFVLGRASVKPSPFSQVLPTPTAPISTPTPDPTADWKMYRNEKLGFEINYPTSFNLTEKTNLVEIFSPLISCRCNYSDGRELQDCRISESKITFQIRSGLNYKQIWKDAFGFDFSNNSYDGEKNIDGKKAYYFFQGAESLFGRTAYLVASSPTQAIEINTYIPSLVSNCEATLKSPNENNELYNTILSTFRFLD